MHSKAVANVSENSTKYSVARKINFDWLIFGTALYATGKKVSQFCPLLYNKIDLMFLKYIGCRQ